MSYFIDGTEIKTRFFKTEEMSLIEKILLNILFLGIIALIQFTIDMPVKALVYAVFATVLIYWHTWK